MIYHRGGEPERGMHCWFNVMAHKPWITAEFVTLCWSMSMVSNTLCSHFFGQWSYWGYTHAFTNLHIEVMSWISCAYDCRLCMDLPEANSITITVHDLYCLWAACPCLFSLAGQPYFSLFPVGGARGREKYVWTPWPAFRAVKECNNCVQRLTSHAYGMYKSDPYGSYGVWPPASVVCVACAKSLPNSRS